MMRTKRTSKIPKKDKVFSKEEKILAEYSAKLVRESWIKSIICGLIIGFGVGLIVGLISYFTNFNGLWIALGGGVVAAAVTSVVFRKKLFCQSAKITATRVDGLGMEERVITMLELAGETSVIAQKQRENTQEKLATVTPKRLKFSIFKIPVVALVVVAILSTFTVTASVQNAYAHANYKPPVVEKSEDDLIIEQLIRDMYRIIAEADIREVIREQLNDLVDDLVKSLKPTDTLAVKIAKITATWEKIQAILEKEMGRKEIAETLQEHASTTDLGKAIGIGTAEKVNAAFDKMYETLIVLVHADKVAALIQTADDIEEALADASDTDPKLAAALQALADAFREAAKKPPMGGDQPAPGDSMDEAIKDAIGDAKDAVNDALKDQEGTSNAEDDLKDTVGDALGDLGGSLPEESEEDEEKDDPGSSTPPSGGEEVEIGKVIDGETPYLDVYKEYYEKAMELLASGDLSPEMREMIEKYFDNINN